MASPKINTILSFATKGVGGVTNDMKSVVSGVNGATSAVDKLSAKISSIQKGVAFQSVVTAAGAVKDAFSAVADTVSGAVSAVYGMAASQAAAADAIGKTSALLGMQVGELQAIRSAGQHVGMSVESIDSAMQKFSINVGRAAAGEKLQLDLMNALGVATRNADGSLRSQTDLLMDVADAYSKLSDTQDRNRVSQELFGRSAVQMSALLKDGSSGIRAAVEQYERTNAGYTADQTTQAAAFNDQLQTMREYIGGVQKDLFFALVPAFTKLFDGVSNFIDANRPKINSIVSSLADELPGVLQDITDVLPTILSGVSMIASGVSAVVDFTGPWVPILSAAGVLIGGAILTAVGAVGVAVSTVGAAFGGVIVAAAPIIATVGGIAVAIGEVGYMVYKCIENFEMLKSAVTETFAEIKKVLWNSTMGIFGKAADFFGGIINEKNELGDFWRSKKFEMTKFENYQEQIIPPGESNIAEATGVPATSSSSSLTVDFRGVPRGTKITPSNNFDYNNIDYSAGYAFGG